MAFRALVFVSCIAVTIGQNVCPDGYKNLFGKKCVKYLTSSTYTWETARAACQAEGAELVSIHSQAENDAYFAPLAGKTQGAFIGYSTDASKAASWSDATSIDFKNFGPSSATCSFSNSRTILTSTPGGPNNGMWTCPSPMQKQQAICQKAATKKTPTVTCPAGYENLFGNQCVKFYLGDNYNYDQAEARCVQDGTHLASIHSQVENDAYYSVISDAAQAAYIGFKTDANAAPFWIDGTPMNYTNIADVSATGCEVPDARTLLSSHPTLPYANNKWLCPVPTLLRSALCQVTGTPL